MEKETLVVKDEEVLNFYDEIGSKHFKLQGETLEKFGEKKIDIYFKSISFTTSIISVMGIIAGFGFTTFTSVQNKLLFFSGEFILIYGILKGLAWVQLIYNQEYKGLDDAQNKFNNFFNERNTLFLVVYNQLISTKHEINKADFKKLQDKDNESLKLFESVKGSKLENKIYSLEIYWCLLIGSSIVLFSLFYIDLRNFLIDYYSNLHCFSFIFQ